MQEYDEEEHDYRLMKKADVAADKIFSQLKSLLQTLGVAENGMVMSEDGWKLEITADKPNVEDEGSGNEEEKKEEDDEGERIQITERVKLNCEILMKDGEKYFFAKKVGGSYKHFMHLWE